MSKLEKLILITMMTSITACGTASVKLDKGKITEIKKIAVVENLFEIPVSDTGNLRQNLLMGLVADKFDKGFATIRPELIGAQSQVLSEIREEIARRLSSDMGFSVLSGKNLVTSRDYQSLEKKGIQSIPLAPFTRAEFPILLAEGEKNFLKPAEASFMGNKREDIFIGMMEDGDLKVLTKQLCEHLKVDAVIFSANIIKAYVASNKTGTLLGTYIFIFDKNGDKVLAGKAFAEQDLQGGDDLAGFKVLLAKHKQNTETLFLEIGSETGKKK